MIWQLADLMDAAEKTKRLLGDEWVPARPINWRYTSFEYRLKAAWLVFTGKADAVVWPAEGGGDR